MVSVRLLPGMRTWVIKKEKDRVTEGHAPLCLCRRHVVRGSIELVIAYCTNRLHVVPIGYYSVIMVVDNLFGIRQLGDLLEV